MSTIKITGKIGKAIVHSLNITLVLLMIFLVSGTAPAQESDTAVQEKTGAAEKVDEDQKLTGIQREWEKISVDAEGEEATNANGSLFMALMQLVIALAIIVAVIIVVVWLMRVLLFRRGVLKPEVLKILGQTHLSPKQSIFLVEMPGRILIIGATQNNISLLTEVKDEETIETIKERMPSGTFSSMLQKESAEYEAKRANEEISKTAENLRKKAATMKDTAQDK
jgi:flagellar protein FliO/FliZ